jgi:uncharacterized protein YceK
VLVLVLALSASGCGTTLNIQREFVAATAAPPEFFGGVRSEYEFITTPQEPPIDVRFLFLPFILIDLPLSAVADTVTLPWVAVRRAIAAPTGNVSDPPECNP